jgi:hypothetical protein
LAIDDRAHICYAGAYSKGAMMLAAGFFYSTGGFLGSMFGVDHSEAAPKNRADT